MEDRNMLEQKRLIPKFYELAVEHIMDKRVWDLPLIEKGVNIHNVLSILRGKSHIWVGENKESKELVGVITEHDVLSVFAPKRLPSYFLTIPDVRSIQHGTAETAEKIMSDKVIFCKPDDKIVDALQKMISYKIRRLPVVVYNRIIGELTLHHLIRKYYAATQYHPIKGD
jgi:predicted transcriptional regulator